MKILAPISPFITDKIHKELYKGKIHNETFPEVKEESQLTDMTQKILDFNSMVWKKKKDSGISLRDEIQGIGISKELELFKEDLTKMHNLK